MGIMFLGQNDLGIFLEDFVLLGRANILDLHTFLQVTSLNFFVKIFISLCETYLLCFRGSASLKEAIPLTQGPSLSVRGPGQAWMIVLSLIYTAHKFPLSLQ